MVQKIKIQCPAKINLDLKILGRRPDGFHDIASTMLAIGLFDYLTISYEPAQVLSITLSGTSNEIPYDENNIVHKAIKLFFNTLKRNAKIEVFIEKNIPVCAGLAGGSTDAAGAIFGLNEMLNRPFEHTKLHEMCAQLGSDLNFCLEGGCKKTSSRGEILDNAPFFERKLSLIKPVNLAISAKEAYSKFAAKVASQHDLKSGNFNNTPDCKTTSTLDRKLFINDLEWAVLEDYKELQLIKERYPQAFMTGSGPTYFAFNTDFLPLDGYWIKNDLKTYPHGVSVVK